MILLVILLTWISRALPSLASEIRQPSSVLTSTTRQPTSKPPTDDELQALLQHWKEEFGSDPKTSQITTCSDFAAQERKVNELGKIVADIIGRIKNATKDNPQMAEGLKSPLLKELADLRKEHSDLVYSGYRGKIYRDLRAVSARLDALPVFSEGYFFYLSDLRDDSWVQAVAIVRQAIKDSSCDSEYLTKAAKEVDDREAQINVLVANEARCRASHKCKRERALAEAMTDSVPNICGDLEDIKLSQQRLISLQSTPSGRADKYNLDATRERIQLAWAEVAKLKATFAKETGQQFSARLCSKIPH